MSGDGTGARRKRTARADVTAEARALLAELDPARHGAGANGAPHESPPATAPDAWRPRVRSLAELAADPAVTAPPRWVLSPLVEAAETALLSAPPKTGKSTLVAQLAAEKSRGGEALDGTRLEAGVVLWLAQDEPARRLVPRLLAFGADPERLFVVEREPGHLLTAAHLAALLAEYRPALVVLDTTSQLALDARVDANDGAQVGGFLRPLVDAVRAASTEADPCAAVFIHHAPHHAARAAGSLQWGAIVDADVVLRRPRRNGDPKAPEPDDEPGTTGGDDGARILEGVTRAGGPLKLRLTYAAGRYAVADRPAPLVDRVRTLLLTMRAAGNIGAGHSSGAKLRTALGCNEAALGDVLRTLVERGEVRRVGTGRSPQNYYEPTDAAKLYAPAGAKPEEVGPLATRDAGRTGENVREEVPRERRGPGGTRGVRP